MSPSPPPSRSHAAEGVNNPNKSLGFLANAAKRKHNFIQWLAMTGLLLLSIRSVGQKYRIHELREDNFGLEEEQKSLKNRLNNIKQSLFAEADLDPTGSFAARLRTLFGEDN